MAKKDYDAEWRQVWRLRQQGLYPGPSRYADPALHAILAKQEGLLLRVWELDQQLEAGAKRAGFDNDDYTKLVNADNS